MSQIEIFYEGELRTRALYQKQTLFTDAPKENQGRGEMFSPTDLLATALGSCVLTLIGIAGNRLKLDLSGLRLTVDKEFGAKRRLTLHVYCPTTFSLDIQQKLESAATHCPVHQSLHPDIQQEFVFHWGSQ